MHDAKASQHAESTEKDKQCAHTMQDRQQSTSGAHIACTRGQRQHGGTAECEHNECNADYMDDVIERMREHCLFTEVGFVLREKAVPFAAKGVFRVPTEEAEGQLEL
jgi:hypothetical protein